MIFPNKAPCFLLLAAACIFCGCSAFRSSTQTLSITSNVPDAKIKLNAEEHALPFEEDVSRSTVWNITCEKEGYVFQQQIIDYHLNTTGWLDLVGAALIDVPIIGLFFPGAFSLETTSVHFELQPEGDAVASGD